MKQKKALITGITGQDGSYLAEHLLWGTKFKASFAVWRWKIRHIIYGASCRLQTVYICIPELWKAFRRSTKFFRMFRRMSATTLPHRVLFQFHLKTSFQRCKRTSTERIICWRHSKILIRNADFTLQVLRKCLVKSRKLHNVKPPVSISAQFTVLPKWLVLN